MAYVVGIDIPSGREVTFIVSGRSPQEVASAGIALARAPFLTTSHTAVPETGVFGPYGWLKLRAYSTRGFTRANVEPIVAGKSVGVTWSLGIAAATQERVAALGQASENAIDRVKDTVSGVVRDVGNYASGAAAGAMATTILVVIAIVVAIILVAVYFGPALLSLVRGGA